MLYLPLEISYFGNHMGYFKRENKSWLEIGINAILRWISLATVLSVKSLLFQKKIKNEISAAVSSRAYHFFATRVFLKMSKALL